MTSNENATDKHRADKSTIDNPKVESALIVAPSMTLKERHAVYLYAIGHNAKESIEGAGIKYQRETFKGLFLKQEAQDYLMELYEEQKNGHLISMNQMQVELITRIQTASDRDVIGMIKLLAQLQGTLQDENQAKVAININWGEDDDLAWRKQDNVIEADYDEFPPKETKGDE